ncbi:MAG: TRAP transporter substrate-binding protein [Moorellales bacterium]
MRLSVKWVVIALLLVAVLALGLVGGCAKSEQGTASTQGSEGAAQPATPSPSTQTIVLKFAATYSPNHPQAIADQAWFEKIEKETGGRVKFEPVWGGALMKADQAFIELANGVADVSEFSGAYVKEGFDIEKAMRVLFCNVPDREVARRIYHELRAKYPQIDAEFSKIKVLAYHAITPYQVATVKKPIRKVGDFKGLMLKVSGDHLKIAQALGADASPIPMSETYVALQKGTIDGAMVPYETLKSFRFGEVVKYVTELNMATGPTPHRGMNLNTWNKLPPDIQKVFEDNIEWYGRKIEEELFKADASGIDFAKQQGVEFIKLSDEELKKYRNVVDKVIQEQAKALDTKGLPGTQIYEDIKRLSDQYLKK